MQWVTNQRQANVDSATDESRRWGGRHVGELKLEGSSVTAGDFTKNINLQGVRDGGYRHPSRYHASFKWMKK